MRRCFALVALTAIAASSGCAPEGSGWCGVAGELTPDGAYCVNALDTDEELPGPQFFCNYVLVDDVLLPPCNPRYGLPCWELRDGFGQCPEDTLQMVIIYEDGTTGVPDEGVCSSRTCPPAE